MKVFKLLLKEVKPKEGIGGYVDKDAVKIGHLVFPFKGKIEDEEVSFKKGDEIAFQHGNKVTLDGEELQLVSINNIVWQK